MESPGDPKNAAIQKYGVVDPMQWDRQPLWPPPTLFWGYGLSLAYNPAIDSLFIGWPATRRARSSNAKSSSTQMGGAPQWSAALFL
jgi:hypothetical protein